VIDTLDQQDVDGRRERRLRRVAKNRGFALQKFRTRRDPHAIGNGTYRLVDPFVNCVVAGDEVTSYGLTLDNVEEWLGTTQ
jgi:hypothetical protein